MAKYINPYTDFGFKKLFGEEANNEPIFQKAFGTAELASLSAEQRAIYEENLIQYWGMKSALETAVEAREVEIAKTMLYDNEPTEKVAKYTGLAVKQIEKLRAELKNKN